jgi:hypothetical protein
LRYARSLRAPCSLSHVGRVGRSGKPQLASSGVTINTATSPQSDPAPSGSGGEGATEPGVDAVSEAAALQAQQRVASGSQASSSSSAPEPGAATTSTSSSASLSSVDGGEGAAVKQSGFINRVTYGILLGLAGAAIVVVGKIPFLLATMLVVYQATQVRRRAAQPALGCRWPTRGQGWAGDRPPDRRLTSGRAGSCRVQEYYGFITSKGISKGMTPPPPFVSSMTTALCLSITAFTYLTQGKSGTVISVAAFVLLCMNVLSNKKPTFAQLTSSVFGLFYCGEWLGEGWGLAGRWGGRGALGAAAAAAGGGGARTRAGALAGSPPARRTRAAACLHQPRPRHHRSPAAVLQATCRVFGSNCAT